MQGLNPKNNTFLFFLNSFVQLKVIPYEYLSVHKLLLNQYYAKKRMESHQRI